MKTLVFVSYDSNLKEEKQVEIPEKINNIYFSYDGGRLSININGKEIFYTAFAGNDCAVTIG